MIGPGKQNDSIAVRPLMVVPHLPALGGLRELLLVDQDPDRLEPCVDSDRQDSLL